MLPLPEPASSHVQVPSSLGSNVFVARTRGCLLVLSPTTGRGSSRRPHAVSMRSMANTISVKFTMVRKVVGLFEYIANGKDFLHRMGQLGHRKESAWCCA